MAATLNNALRNNRLDGIDGVLNNGTSRRRVVGLSRRGLTDSRKLPTFV